MKIVNLRIAMALVVIGVTASRVRGQELPYLEPAPIEDGSLRGAALAAGSAGSVPPEALSSRQEPQTAAAVDDDSEKRIGRKGAKQLSLGFNASGFKTETPTYDSRGRINGTKTSTQGFFFGQGDLGNFLSDSFLLRVGAAVSGQIGSNVDPRVQGLLGFLYYFSPNSGGSLYLGMDATKDLGTEGSKPYGYGRLGLQTMLNNRASFFVEGGYCRVLASESSGTGSFQIQAGLRFAFR